jgi:hypothetical protein
MFVNATLVAITSRRVVDWRRLIGIDYTRVV